MDIVIKKFKEMDIDLLYEILRLRSKVFVEEQKCPYEDLDGKDKESLHLMAYKNDKIVGYLRIIPPGLSYDAASIGRVLVIEEERKNGIARELVKKAISIITEEWKEENIKIGAQAHLENFYKSIGFEGISEVYLEDNIPHLDMEYRKDKKR